MKNTAQKAYRNALLAMLGATRVLSRADFSIPSKWLSFFENIRISSDIAHAKLYEIDEEVGEEFFEKEELVEKKFGHEKFYSQEEVEELKENSKDIDIQLPKL
jgi:hypothetical protein